MSSSVPSHTESGPIPGGRRCIRLLISVFLALAILGIYRQVNEFEFVSFDDPMYVQENVHVHGGITRDSIIWAFSTTYAGNWHPLTWISHMADVEIFGMNPGMHHMTNVFFHIANSIVLFLLFAGMTGSTWRSAFAAALFALHPLHVESVAWISERKDVLSAFFGLLSLLCYAWYTRRPGVVRYIPVLLLFVLSLLAKPMFVTLPFVLLLFDFWPLRRFPVAGHPAPESGKGSGGDGGRLSRAFPLYLIAEKVPLFALSALSSIVTFYAQHKGGAVSTLELLPLWERAGNAAVSYASYLGKMLWPAHLAVFYPYPAGLGVFKAAAAAAMLAAITVLCIHGMRRFSYMIVGWLFYLGTLVPVIGIVQVGSQAMADRYTYVPLIGIFIMTAWGITDLLQGSALKRHVLVGASASAIALCSFSAYTQAGFWKDSMTLFSHALDVTEGNYLAHDSLGGALQKQGDFDRAISHYRQAISLKPGYRLALNNLGSALYAKGRTAEAISQYRKTLRMYPEYAGAHYNLGVALSACNRTEEAIRHYREAIRLDPDNAEARNNLGFILAGQGNCREAVSLYREALRIKPGFTKASMNLGSALACLGELDEALRVVREAHEMTRGEQAIALRLASLYVQKGELDAAAGQYRQVLSQDPDNTDALFGLAVVHSKRGEYGHALTRLKRIIEVRPGSPEGYYNIACMHARMGNAAEAVSWLGKAMDKGFDDWKTLAEDKDIEGIRQAPQFREFMKGRQDLKAIQEGRSGSGRSR